MAAAAFVILDTAWSMDRAKQLAQATTGLRVNNYYADRIRKAAAALYGVPVFIHTILTPVKLLGIATRSVLTGDQLAQLT